MTVPPVVDISIVKDIPEKRNGQLCPKTKLLKTHLAGLSPGTYLVEFLNLCSFASFWSLSRTELSDKTTR